jgi:predicted nucleotidyltransferase
MNIEQLRTSGRIIFEGISGSHAYGTNVEGSDVDVRGVFILPTDEVLAGRYIPQISDNTNDETYYEIGRFIELLSKGNPNMQELFNLPDDCVRITTDDWVKYFPEETRAKFITTKLKHTYTGYAYSQIQKAKGLNKKINQEAKAMTRKDVLDFCYVLMYNEHTVNFKKWCDINGAGDPIIAQKYIGLAKVNNIPNTYSMYDMDDGDGGIIGDDSNNVRTVSIPKDACHLTYLRFDVDAYSMHCKDYREYTEWLENRNEARYRDNLKGEQGYDHKNMMHCMRLLNMSKDIADGKGIVVRRPEREYLLQIRRGEMKYDELLDDAESMIDDIKAAFDASNLPREVKPKFTQNLLLTIRKDNL